MESAREAQKPSMAAEVAGVALSGCDLLCAAGPGAYVGHVARTLILGLVANGLDVASDIFNALNYLKTKKVERTIEANWTLPETEACIKIDGETSADQYECEVTDFWWATLTFSFIQVWFGHLATLLLSYLPQLPGVVLFLCTSFALLITCCMIVSEEYKPHPLHGCLLVTFLLVPFPLVVAAQQMWTLFHPTDQMQVSPNSVKWLLNPSSHLKS